jgi:hypothetical protein
MNPTNTSKKVFLTTYGWPMGAVLYDHTWFFEKYLVNLT